MRPGSLCLQRNCFRRQLDVELMFGTIALAGKPSTGAVLTLRLAFVTLLLAPPTRTNKGRVSVKTRSWSSVHLLATCLCSLRESPSRRPLSAAHRVTLHL